MNTVAIYNSEPDNLESHLQEIFFWRRIWQKAFVLAQNLLVGTTFVNLCTAFMKSLFRILYHITDNENFRENSLPNWILIAILTYLQGGKGSRQGDERFNLDKVVHLRPRKGSKEGNTKRIERFGTRKKRSKCH